ncbi:MAG: tRNA uridine-5-carboxymethylaminomethyl(34) synthesis GTPase MnmE [Legionellales bacterium RIFCSPHIGHO2_12_FULL_35_11]|nr:MAG: tRNA uridine-5-carboxymethylaminomethyl(34) synthesis GTPase MnmE [Legionellales bacterium RIFCSPHIGHO2_12_FULL_35_11]
MDTIVAIATPPGRGGVGIVRISGKLAYAIALKITKKNEIIARQAYYLPFYTQNDELLDKGLILSFKAPHSFTGEDIIELHAHGSPIVLDNIVKECITYGARIAKPGEFSERAFLNDKIDLTQAEAIADLIDASSTKAATLALRSLQGDFSKKIIEISDKIVHLRLYVEAAIDFPEEEIDFLGDGKVLKMLQKIILKISTTKDTAHSGAILREGLSVVIAGAPNAGKSTLINLLAGQEVAIVTDIAGTTRDVMRQHILLDDIPINIIDTAGLRDTQNIIEQEGIKRALDEVSKADCVLLLTDITDLTHIAKLSKDLSEKLPKNTPIIHVFNKIDKINNLDAISFDSTINKENVIFISAKLGNGIELLSNKIKEVVGYSPAEGQFLARRRHIQALDAALQLLINGELQLTEHRAGELLAEDLRLAHQVLGEITGEFSSDDLLGVIFANFCIGK